uniref:Uncharacterized protein n=1 Tax=Oryza brachyantha TaxID=4533 RepID=J3MZC2_ORYBR
MCGIKQEVSGESPCSSPERQQTVWTAPPKRPAGRTKFRETRHPVYRGVRRRGNAGSLADVRHAVAEAVEDFLHRGRPAALLSDDADAMSATSSSSPSSPHTDDDESVATDGDESSPATDLAFELDVLSDMGWDLYYASLAQGMLMEPPSAAAAAAFGDIDTDANLADVALWSY